MNSPYFIAEVSSNHARDLGRCIDFIKASAEIGCDAVKFQLFKIDELFAPEILSKSEEHRRRRQWELPLEFLPDLAKASADHGLAFTCTPFYLKAVEELDPHVSFFKIASYELPWDALIKACAATGKPLILSTGMATIDEIEHAVAVFHDAGGKGLTLLHCVSGYPTPIEFCNLAAIKTLRETFDVPVGWSDHSRNPVIVSQALNHWGASVVEFHLDLDEQGAEYASGHCWLPKEIAPVIAACRQLEAANGTGIKEPTPAEISDRIWRADPSDGLRPFLEMRREWAKK
ncbi:N-acetylneuraminate synthase family protein [Kordiimonas pumila]|uniref:N-acetylneuraminate synthase family protein n=1 Tax=Kordiimonas pumila TaxID=2161677 RepID=A0ABV7D289_9PROT|nr:N-acetylneuraminate synthase family protein [Kordiimonas pumila]